MNKQDASIDQKNKITEHEKLLRNIFDTAAIGVMLADSDYKFIQVNPKFCQIMGYTEKELLELTFLDITYHEDIEISKETMINFHKKKLPYFEIIKRYVRKDGNNIWGSTTVSAVRSDSGELLYTLAMIEDITERKHAEEVLKESEKHFRLIAEQSFVGIAIFQDNLVKYVNKAYAGFVGYTPEEIMNIKPGEMFKLIHPDDREFMIEQARKKEKNEPGYINSYTYRAIHRLGDIKYLSLYSRTLPFKGRHADYVISNDITDQIMAEKEIKKLNEELEERIKERTSELEAVNKELDSFNYSVSHDLRAPLRAIEGFSNALYEDYINKLDKEGKDYLNRIKKGTEKMGELIDNMLHMSRIRQHDINIRNINLSEMVHLVSSSIKKSEAGRDIKFIIADGIKANADSKLINIAITNLIGNAVKFTSQNKTATIEFNALKKENTTIYYIKDNGIGFNENYKDKLFIPFRRLHSEKEYSGIGIGLSITHSIIRKHKGNIWAEGEEGKGAVFYFTLG